MSLDRIQAPVSRKKYNDSADVQAVMRIHVGYRPLIDWSQTPGWAQDISRTGANQSENKRGVHVQGSDYPLIVEKNWSGSSKAAPLAHPGSSEKLPGDFGVAFGVSEGKVPSFGGTSRNIAKAFGNNTPQWVYRMAEMLKWEGTMSITELQSMAEGNAADTFSNSPFDANAMKEMNVQEKRTFLKGNLSGSARKEVDTLTGKEIDKKYGGTRKDKKDFYGKFKTDNPNYNEDPDALPFGYREMDNQGSPNLGPEGVRDTFREDFMQNQWKRFPKFGSKGKNLHYTRTFSEIIYQESESSITSNFNNIRNEIRAKFGEQAGSRLKSQTENVSQLGGPGSDIGDWGGVGKEGPNFTDTDSSGQVIHGGGATHQEKLVEVLGLGYAPKEKEEILGGTRRPDPASAPYGSRNIDVVLENHDDIVAPINYKRVDLTTSSYQHYTSHHGIGPTASKSSDAKKGAFKSVAKARTEVLKEQKKMITLYNKFIGLLQKHFDVKDPHELRKAIAYKEISTSAKTETDRNNLLKDVWAGFSKTQKDLAWNEMRTALDWVLHSLGTYLVDDPYWASAMPIWLMIDNQAQKGTLIIEYTMGKNGKFNQLQKENIVIHEYSLETWLYNLASPDVKAQMTQEQAEQAANDSFAMLGYVQEATEAGLHRAAYDVGGAAVAHLAMPIPGDISTLMDHYMTHVINQISIGLETQVSRELVHEATTFSHRMRRQMPTDTTEYMQGISDLFLGGQQVGGSHWYLWAAPYVSTIYPQRGFALQKY